MNSSLNPVKFLIEDEADRSELGYVYVLRGIGSGEKFYKIGRSRDINVRMKQLRTSSMPFQFELVYWHPIEAGEPDVEYRLHDHFRPYRTRGEWFVVPDEKELCDALEGFLGMCPVVVHEGYRLEEQHYRSRQIVGLA